MYFILQVAKSSSIEAIVERWFGLRISVKFQENSVAYVDNLGWFHHLRLERGKSYERFKSRVCALVVVVVVLATVDVGAAGWSWSWSCCCCKLAGWPFVAIDLDRVQTSKRKIGKRLKGGKPFLTVPWIWRSCFHLMRSWWWWWSRSFFLLSTIFATTIRRRAWPG